MLAAKPPVTGDQKPRPKSARKPLQPKNIQSHPHPIVEFAKPKPNTKQENAAAKISLAAAAAANRPVFSSASPVKLEILDASLAEELSAIKKRLERMRIDRDRTESVLNEKDSVLDIKRKEIEHRGEVQMMLEIEVDRLYRLFQLHSQAMVKFSPIRSLREKERTKVVSESESKEMKSEDKEESVSVSETSPDEYSTVSSNFTEENI